MNATQALAAHQTSIQRAQIILDVEPDGRYGDKSRAAEAQLRKLAINSPDAEWPEGTTHSTGPIDTIIDIYHGEDVSLTKLKAAGIIAIIHKATEGTVVKDGRYHDRQADAESLGMLWGSYHFSSGNDGVQQAQHYLDFAQPEDSDVMCLDFEPSSHGPDMTRQQATDFVEHIFAKTGRYPMIYGGSMIREKLLNAPMTVFSKTPLWYCRYNDQPIGVPKNIWPNGCTLFQFTDGHLGPEPHRTAGYNLDRNRFNGTEQELRSLWPFTRKP